MVTIPQKIKDLLNSQICQKNIRITFPNYERSDICNDLIVKDSVSLTESICSQDALRFGLCESPIFRCEVVGVSNIKGCSIQVFCEIYCEPSVEGAVYRPDIDAYVYPIPYGMFTVDSCKRSADMIHREIIAYNAMHGEWYPPEIFNALAYYSSPANLPLKFTVEALAYMVFPSSLGKELQRLGRTRIVDADHMTVGGYYADTTCQVVADGVAFKYKYVTIDYGIACVRSGSSITDGYSYSLNAYKVDYDKFDIVRGLDYINDYLRSIGVQTYLEWRDVKTVRNPFAIDGYYEPAVDEPSISAYISPYMVQSGNNYVMGRNAGVNQPLIVDGRWHACMGIEYAKLQSSQFVRYYDSAFRRDDVTFAGNNYETANVKYNLRVHHGRTTITDICIPVSISVYSTRPVQGNPLPTPEARYKFPGARIEYGAYSWSDEELIGDSANIALLIQNDGLTQVQTETWAPYATSRSSTGTRNDYTYVNGINELSRYDLRSIVSAAYELKGLIGRFDRYGELDLIDLTKKFELTPSSSLYPGEGLKPQSATGGRMLPSQTREVWYDDEYQKSYGRVCCTFKDANNEDQWAYFDLVDDYDDNSEKYQEYSLTDNEIIKSRSWTYEEINAHLEFIGNRLKTVQYMSCTATASGHPEIEAGDTVELSSKLNDSIVALVTQRELKGEMSLVDDIISI